MSFLSYSVITILKVLNNNGLFCCSVLQINCIQYELVYLTSNVSEAGAYP